MSQTEKNCSSCNVEESFKKFLGLDPNEDDFQNSVSSSLSTDTSLLKLSRRSVQQFSREVANSQTDGQKNAR